MLALPKVAAAFAAALAALAATGASASSSSAPASSSPPVNIRLRAPWDAPPLLLELLEATETEDPNAFWPLLEALTRSDEQRSRLTGASAQGVYNAVVQALDDSGLLPDIGSRRNWEMAVALHSEAPKVAAFAQVAQTTGVESRWHTAMEQDSHLRDNCGSWVDWHGRVICSAEDLEAAIKDADSSATGRVAVYPFDHKLPTSKTPDNATTTVLYGQPLSSNFYSLHKMLRDYAQSSPSFRYLLRWRPSSSSTNAEDAAKTSGHLAGYGAALDLKKVDYLVIDDRKLEHASSAPSLEGEAGNAAAEKQLDDRRWLDAALLGGDKDVDASVPLDAKEMELLGLKAAQAIVASSDPIRAMKQLSHDFPLHSTGLARGAVQPTDDLDYELESLQFKVMRPGLGEIWVNGKALTADETVPLGLTKLLRSERTLVNSLLDTPLELTPGEAVDLLSNSTIARAQHPDSEKTQFFDASDRIERAAALKADADKSKTIDDVIGAITWFNDVEKDPEFQKLNPGLMGLLRPLYPGQFPQVRRNAFNLVFTLDLRNKGACGFLAEHVLPLVKTIPMHWGFVPGGLEKGADAEETKLARLFWHVFETYGVTTTTQWLEKLASQGARTEEITLSIAKSQLTKLLKKQAPEIKDVAGFVDKLSETPHQREPLVRQYVARLRLTTAEDPDGHIMINGEHYPFIGKNVFQLIMQLVSIQIQQLQRPIYYRQLKDDADVSNYFYDLPTTFASRSELVFPPYNDKGEVLGPKPRAVDLVQALRPVKNHPVATTFLYPDSETRVNTTMWLVGNLDAPATVSALREALAAMQKTPFRLGLVHSRSDSTHTGHLVQASGLPLSSFIGNLIKEERFGHLLPEQVLEVLAEAGVPPSNLDEAGKVLDDAGASAVPGALPVKLGEEDAASAVNDAKVRSWNAANVPEGASFWEPASAFVRALDVPTGESAIVVNGRVLSGVNFEKIAAEDLHSLVQNERNRRIDVVVAALRSINGKLDELSREDAAMAIALCSSVMSVTYFKDETKEGMFAPPVVQRTTMFDRVPASYSRFEVGNKDRARLRFQAIIDPLSKAAQRWSSLLDLVAGLDDVHVQVILNPNRNITEMPLKRFYRYDAPRALSFDGAGAEVPATVSFLGMPEDAVLTMGLDAPPAWLTMASEAVYDLDNILLKDVPADGREAGVLAVYDLKQILIEGHAREGRNVPRGLQLVLQTPDGSETLDTIVMANLAYFQFRAKPGLYRLSIREGKSDELYAMRSVGNHGWDSPDVEVTGADITLDSFSGLTIYPRVEKRAGKEEEELLEDLEGDEMLYEYDDDGQTADGSGGPVVAKAKSLWKSAARKAQEVLASAPGAGAGAGARTGVATARPKAAGGAGGQAEINIFTVASGHLYERMTYIMILSVLRHTSSSVKFWFIENFLSPSFKAFIPHLARAHGFQYEVVTYAWPHWLRAQTEKQRTIWGYKILFLDVLFPLDVDKVIFVDSDQVVRADLAELAHTDLRGAPYGFPPMGNDSHDMDGYRFWKRGYWADFLRGRPYHISALYVVDLRRFRAVAAGDKLRGQYQALSADPGSLANLDQDLPQTLMFHVPMRTLDQEWLWCETWCSAEWLHRAKTIDLCSNPKTHESKLDRARRQIPEWTELDEEVQALARRVARGEAESGGGGGGGGGGGAEAASLGAGVGVGVGSTSETGEHGREHEREHEHGREHEHEREHDEL